MDLDWDEAARWLAVPSGRVRMARLPRPSFNIAPGRTVAIAVQDVRGERYLTGASWSLVPRWSAGSDLGYPTYNARVESIAGKPTFAASTRSMRAVVPASGYYEWKGGRGGRPFYFHSPDGSPLAMAGLYSWWRPGVDGAWRLTATVVTCAAVDGPAGVHRRMPLLVPASMMDAWLDPRVDGAGLLGPLVDAGAGLSRMLRFHEVAPLPDPGPGSPDGPALVRPLRPRRDAPARQPSLF